MKVGTVIGPTLNLNNALASRAPWPERVAQAGTEALVRSPRHLKM